MTFGFASVAQVVVMVLESGGCVDCFPNARTHHQENHEPNYQVFAIEVNILRVAL